MYLYYRNERHPSIRPSYLSKAEYIPTLEATLGNGVTSATPKTEKKAIEEIVTKNSLSFIKQHYIRKWIFEKTTGLTAKLSILYFIDILFIGCAMRPYKYSFEAYNLTHGLLINRLGYGYFDLGL